MNHLSREKSPYLIQHQHNPVDWYPWGEEAFTKARDLNRPIFLSIGYSTCYWCHMMEKDSFEREDVAAILNTHFVAIKLDREERPDIDKIYMDAVVGLTGHGGWPMSVFLTPSLQPFYGGTFFWRDHFCKLLLGIAEAWETRRTEIEQTAGQLTGFLKNSEGDYTSAPLEEEIFSQVIEQFEHRFDNQHGGFGGAPKFPPSQALGLLLQLFKRTGNESALNMATFTLEKMARGGIYDHLGGGFSRYATDKYWLVPHFEKMLYDNAQLAAVYLDAFAITGNTMFSEVARETLNYVLSDMLAPEKGFYSAEDAGEVGKEGEFYVWSYDELESLLDKSELAEVKLAYGVSSGGNFEHKNILHLGKDIPWSTKANLNIASATKKLLATRKLRKRPHLDSKIITAWNGLMIFALAKGAQVLHENAYQQAAEQCATFIEIHLLKDKRLLRRYCDGVSGISGQLDDYAYFIQGLIELYKTTGNDRWGRLAYELQQTQDRYFWDNVKGGYFYSAPGDPSVIVRKKEFHDGAEPSPNAVSAANLLRLYTLTADLALLEKAKLLFAVTASEVNSQPIAFASLLSALDFYWNEASQPLACSADGCTIPPLKMA